MLRLDNPIQPYRWGSKTAIPGLLGVSATDEPAAELWMGAHPRAPSLILDTEGGSLRDRIGADPARLLGSQVAERFGELPFLFKILAAEQPLSLQAHPDLETARAGFARENEAGISTDAPHRNYRDANHKPELLCALEPFEILCGFAAPAAIVERLAAIECDALRPMAELLGPGGASMPLRAAFEWTLGLSLAQRQAIFAELPAGLHRASSGRSPHTKHAEALIGLAEIYPDDAGVLGALMLEHRILAPTEAVYLGAGVLHAYLGGLGVELMANSDNVLRGGMTPKHVDPAELRAVLQFEPTPPTIVYPSSHREFESRYATPAAEFELSVIELGGEDALLHDATGPEILLCIEGACNVNGAAGSTLVLSAGQSLFAEPGVQTLRAPLGARVFRAKVPG